jgi:hypothetical protein
MEDYSFDTETLCMLFDVVMYVQYFVIYWTSTDFGNFFQVVMLSIALTRNGKEEILK